MITVEQATDIIFSHKADFGTEKVALEQSIGRILRQEVHADRDFPPFHRVTMDGIAIHYTAFEQGIRAYKVEGVAAAGSPQQSLKESNNCLEVMTGAILPQGVDTVIR